MIRPGLTAAAIVATSLIAAGTLLVAPLMITAGAVGIIFLLFSAQIIRHPRLTAVVTFLLLLLAETKFRTRDAGAMLSGSVDSQVLYELALYAALGWIVVLGFIIPPRPAHRVAPAIAIGLGCYAALAVLSTVWSPSPAITLVRSVQLSILVAVAICLSARADPVTIFQSLLIALVLYCGVMTIIAFVVPGATPRLGVPGKTGRFSWFAVHPGAVAMLASLTVLLLIITLMNGLPRTPGPRRLGIGLAGIAFFGAMLLATRSRADLIAMVGTVGVLFVRRLRLKPELLAAAILGCIGITGLAVTNFGAMHLVNNVLSDNWSVGDYVLRGQTPDQFMSLSSRTELWKDMLPLIAARPVLGWGFESTRSILLDVFFWASYAHNAVVQVVMGLGIVGAALLLPLFGSCFFVGGSGDQLARDGPSFARTTVIGIAVYLGIQSLAFESFAGTPGVAVLVAFVCMLSAADLRRQAREARHPLARPALSTIGRDEPGRAAAVARAYACAS